MFKDDVDGVGQMSCFFKNGFAPMWQLTGLICEIPVALDCRAQCSCDVCDSPAALCFGQGASTTSSPQVGSNCLRLTEERTEKM